MKKRILIVLGLVALVAIVFGGIRFVRTTYFTPQVVIDEDSPELTPIKSAFDSNDLDAAIAQAESLVKGNSRDASALNVLASTYAQKGSIDFQEQKYGQLAIDTATEALTLEPGNVDSYRIIGYGYEIMNKFTEAIDSYNKALSIDPKNAVVLYHRGHAYDLSGDIEKAKADFSAAVALNDNDDQALINLARVYMRESKFKDAEPLLKKTVNVTTNVRVKAEALYGLSSIALYSNYDVQASLDYANQAATADPKFALAYVGIARANISSGDDTQYVAQADEALAKALNLNPNLAAAYEWKAIVQVSQKNSDAAIQTALKAKTIADADISLMQNERTPFKNRMDYYLASLYASKGQKKEAYNAIVSMFQTPDGFSYALLDQAITQGKTGPLANLVGYADYDALVKKLKATPAVKTSFIEKAKQFFGFAPEKALAVGGRALDPSNPFAVQLAKLLTKYENGTITLKQLKNRCDAIVDTLHGDGRTATQNCKVFESQNGSAVIGCTNGVKLGVYVPPLSASCSANVSAAPLGTTVTWTAKAEGLYGPSNKSDYIYEWNGSNEFSAVPNKTQTTRTATSINVTYTTPGVKTAGVKVTAVKNGVPTSLHVLCSNSVNISNQPLTCSDGSAPVNNTCQTSGACVQGSACISAPNSCGMTNGTRDCATNSCIPPSNSLCINSCIDQNGTVIANGESRTYYSNVDGVCVSGVRSCANGTLSGDSSFAANICPDGTQEAGSKPVITSFKMVPAYVNKGETCIMSWTTQNADTCTITGAGFEKGRNVLIPDGNTLTPPIQATSRYTLSCTNKSGTVSQVAQCKLNPSVIEQ